MGVGQAFRLTSKTSRAVGLAVSLALHVLLLVIVLGRTPDPKEEENPRQLPVSVELLPLTSQNTVEPVENESTGEAQVDGIKTEQVCDSENETYMGVGITYAPFSGEILSAPSDYPAYKAGLRPGDIIQERNKTANGWVTYDILREGKNLSFQMKEQPICFIDKWK